MDPSSVLDQTIQDVSNLQAEFGYILGELRYLDTQLLDHKKLYGQKDFQIQRFTRQHGSLETYPKEQEDEVEIKKEMRICNNIQKQKCAMANTALFLVAKHLSNLEKKMGVLGEDGLVPLIEDDIDTSTELSRESSAISGTGGVNDKRRKAGSSGSQELPNTKRRRIVRASSPNQQTSQTPSIPSQLATTSLSHAATPSKEEEELHKNTVTPNVPIPAANDKDVKFDLQDYNDDLFSGYNNEEEDKTLYCFCQSVSYGEMVACDGPSCKYEWFHYSCVNLKEPPRGQWFCPDCRQVMAKNKLKRKKV